MLWTINDFIHSPVCIIANHLTNLTITAWGKIVILNTQKKKGKSEMDEFKKIQDFKSNYTVRAIRTEHQVADRRDLQDSGKFSII